MPEAAAVTLTVIVQLPPVSIVAPAKGLIRMPTLPATIAPPTEFCNVPAVLPAVQVLVVVLLKSVMAPGATGKISVNDTPASVARLGDGLAMTIVKTEVPPLAMDAGANDFVIVGGATTSNVADAGAIVGIAVVLVIAPVLLKYGPAVADLTFTSISHMPPALIFNPVSVTVLAAARAVTVPAMQVPAIAVMAAVGAAELTRPAG